MQSGYFFFSFERLRFYLVLFSSSLSLSFSYPSLFVWRFKRSLLRAHPQWRRSSETRADDQRDQQRAGYGREKGMMASSFSLPDHARCLPAFRSSPLTESLKQASFGAPHHSNQLRSYSLLDYNSTPVQQERVLDTYDLYGRMKVPFSAKTRNISLKTNPLFKVFGVNGRNE